MPRDLRIAATPWRKLADLAARQWGVVGNWQLRRCGVTETTALRWARDGRLHRLHPGVYAVGHLHVPYEGRLLAALLYAGRSSALSHLAAAYHWRLTDVRPQTIEVSSPARRADRPGLTVHHRPGGPQATRHRRFPVTTVARTMIEVARTHPHRDLTRMLGEADYGGILDLAAVHAELRAGLPGSGALRAALAAHDPAFGRTNQELERRFAELIRRAGIEPPLVNVKLDGWTVDALWPGAKVVVELDGHAGHRSPAQLQEDHARDLALRAAGYIVLRYGWRQILEEPERVIADLEAALARRWR